MSRVRARRERRQNFEFQACDNAEATRAANEKALPSISLCPVFIVILSNSNVTEYISEIRLSDIPFLSTHADTRGIGEAQPGAHFRPPKNNK